MIWLNPAAWIALVTVAAPILIHIFVQRKARPLPFPTLRFLQPTRLAALRRHLLDDVPLLLVRAAILAAAVAAFAAPLVVRRQAWNARLTRAIVVDDERMAQGSSPAPPALNGCAAPDCRTFETRSIPDGIRRARAWLEAAPPARREIVVAGPLAIGSITAATMASIPPEVGVRFERVGELPAERTVDGGTVLGLASQGASLKSRAFRRATTIAADGTSVTEASADERPFPIEVVAAASMRPDIDRAIAAVLARHVWAPPEDRRAALAIAGSPAADEAIAKAEAIAVPWMADAAARIASDADLAAAAARSAAGLDASRFAAPWIVVARGNNRQPLAAAAAADDRLLIASAADASNFLTPLLIRASVNAMAEPPDLRSAEVLPIPDEQLNTWTRAPGPVARLRNDSIGFDDRRWLWALVLVLLGFEAWLRRARQTAPTSAFALQPSTESPERAA